MVGETLRRNGRALEVVETLRLVAYGSGGSGVTGSEVQCDQRDAGVGVVDDKVGRGRDLDGLGRERDPSADIAARREHFGTRDAPGDRGLEVLAGELLARRGHGLGVVQAPLGDERVREQRRGASGVDAHAHLDEPVVRVAQRGDRGGRITGDELDHAGEVGGLEQPVAQSQLLERRPRRVQHRAGDVEPAPQRLQYRLAPHRRRLHRGRRGRDPQ